MDQFALLLAAGFLAGSMNAVAGGGTFISFPALILAGLPSVAANASNTVALFPGGLTSLWAYRRDFRNVGGVSLGRMLAASLVGGLIGSVLLLSTPQATFNVVIPWLLLLASLALIFGRQAGEMLRRRVRIGTRPVLIAQILLGIYGGYFGGAVGIMMLSVWGLLGSADLKSMNPARMLLVTATNLVAVLCFIVAGAVRWPETLTLLVGAAAGGYAGAQAGRRLHHSLVRAIILFVTLAMTAVFFVRAYGR